MKSQRDQIQRDQIQRHRTALRRRKLSAPLKLARRLGLLEGRSVLDYGCGRGDDVRALRRRGYDARGFDPYFWPQAPAPADLVYLGYVLNTIESPHERAQALRDAAALAREALIVAVQPGRAQERGRRYRDGIVTQRQTFQRRYGPGELAEYLRGTLGVEPRLIGPGVALINLSDGGRDGL